MAIKIKNSTIIDDSRNIVDAGISTITSLSIGSTEVISSSRQLKNIDSLDATTTATIEAAITNSPNTFTDLNVTGISTFGDFVDIQDNLNVSGVSTFASNVDINASVDISNDLNVSGVTTLASDLDINASVDISNGLNVSGISTFASDLDINASIDVDGHTELDDLNVSGVSTFVGIGTFQSDLYVGGDLYVDYDITVDGLNVRNINASGITTTALLNVGIGGTIITTTEDGNVGLGTTNPTSKLQVSGDIKIDDGGTYSTTIQSQTPTADRVITYPDATGVLALVAGSSGQVTYNLAGINTGDSNFTYDSTAGLSLGKSLTVTDNVNVSGVTTSTGGFIGDVTGNADTATSLETPRTFEITGDVVASAISFDGTGNVSLAATIQPNSVGLGTDTTGDYVTSISGTANEIEVTGGTGEGSTPQIGLPNDVVIQNDLQVNNDVAIQGNLTVYGTETIVNTQSLNVFDKDIILGIGTDNGETDDTANGGGIAIASTEGSPLICLQCGVNTLPGTYKQLLWLKNGTFAGLATDSWITNYAVSIGTTVIDYGTRLAVGDIQITDNDIKIVRDINATGIVTANLFSGSGASLTNIPNGALVNSTVNFGGVTVSLGGTDLSPAFDLSDATGLPISTGVSGLGANVADFLATPSSSNLASAITDETGSGSLVFATSPTLVTPTLGDASATSLNASGIITAATFDGNLTGDVTGNADTATYATSSGIATYATTSGVSTNVIGGIGSLTTLNVSGISTFASDLDINASIDISNDLNVSGVSTFASNVDINASIDISNDLNVVGISTFGSDIDINASIDIDGHTELDDVNVSGVSTFAGAIDANGDLDVDGFTELDATNISETLNVVGVATFASNIDINASIDVDGHTELDNLNVSGVSTFASDLDINASIDVDGHTELDDLNVSGVSTFASDLDINADLDVDGHTELDDLNVSGVSTFIGIGTFQSDLYVGGDLYVDYDITVDELNVRNINAFGITTSVILNVGVGGTIITTTEDGNVGLGTTNPTSKLQVSGDIKIDDGGTYSITIQSQTPTADRVITYPDKTGTIALVAGSSGQVTYNLAGINTGDSNFTYDSTAGLSLGRPLTVTGNVNVSGLSTFSSNVDINASVDVDGHTELDDLNVSGISTFASNVDINASVDISNDLNVLGVSTFASDLDINASVDVDGHTELDDLNVSGVSTFASNVDIDASIDVDGHTELDDLNVSGVSTFSSDLDINASVDISNNLNITGVTTSTGGFVGDLTGNADTATYSVNAGVATNVIGGIASITTLTASGISTFSNNVNIAGTVSIGTTVDIVPYDDLGTLSFEGSAGQLFSITNNLTSGSIFSVNDVSGIPSIDVDADGTIQLAPYGSTEYVGVGLTNPTAKLDVAGDVKVSGLTTTQNLYVSGVSTFINDSVLIGSGTSTGTTTQRLQVTGGAYISGNTGIGTTNPQSKLAVIGDTSISSNLIVSGFSSVTDTRLNSVSEESSIGVGNTINLVYNTGGGNIGIITSPSGPITLNITGIPTDSSFDNRSLTFSVIVNQGVSVAYACSSITLNGVTPTIKWTGGVVAVGATSSYDIFNFTCINPIGSASSTANYVVLGVLNGNFK